MSSEPLAIDLFCGLGGWTYGLLAEGYRVIGFDIERHDYGGDEHYPAQLVLQDVLTLHGSQFRDATLIVASPPCQEYSYMAMPWTRAKKIAAEYRAGMRDTKQLTALFDACFRIQREACEAAGRHIPLIVENVRGAVPWVGPCQGKFGSFYLWGDVPPLLPIAARATMKLGVAHRPGGATNFHRDLNNGVKTAGFRFDGNGGSFQSASVETTGVKAPGMNWSNQEMRGQNFSRLAGRHAEGQKGFIKQVDSNGCIRRLMNVYADRDSEGQKTKGHINRRDGHSHTRHLTNQAEHDEVRENRDLNNGVKAGKSCRPKCSGWGVAQHTGSKSAARKRASAIIAQIPFVLAQYIAAYYKEGL